MKHLYISFYVSLLLISCRVEEDLRLYNKQEEHVKKFLPFTKRNAYEEIDYSKGFKELALRYDSLHRRNITGRDGIEKVLERLKLNRQVPFSELKDIEYIDFSIRSELVEEENGDKWILYPRIQGGKVKNLVSAVLSEDETKLGYYTLDYPNELYIANIELFREAYERAKRERGSVDGYITYNGICGIYNRPDCVIGEVIITPRRPDRGSGGGGGYYGGGRGRDGGEGCAPYIACRPDNDGGYPYPPNNDKNTPCEKLREGHKTNSEYFKKFEDLNKKEIFNKNYEVGYYEKAGAGFTRLEGKEGSTSLRLPDDTTGIYGVLHTHNNRLGVVKIFSPRDVAAFINDLLKNAKTYVGSYADAYCTVLTSEGSYILKYSKDTHPGEINEDTELDWKKWYEDEMREIQDPENSSFYHPEVEEVFMRFMTEKVRIDGLEVYKTTPNHSVKMNYNTNTNRVYLSTPC